MIFNIEELKHKYSNCDNIFQKIKGEINKENLYKIKRGLYSDSLNENRFFIANTILSPSYISFETALSFYDLIPEMVVSIKSATYCVNKTKSFTNGFGTFIYNDVNKKAYPYGIDVYEENGTKILIASKEKALTDTIYMVSPRTSMKEIEELLFDDFRINEEEFDKLDKTKIIELCGLYGSTSLKHLIKYLNRGGVK